MKVIHYLLVDVSRKMYIAGTLWKWTNYFSGWQERWFVLDNGILSYYKSEDDVNTGCKGSVKMSVCDIAVHATDNTRLDLIIPGEQHFYVRASNTAERQQWLVALGSTKASMGKLSEETENPSVTHSLLKTKRSELRLYCDLLMQQIHSVKIAVQQDKEEEQEEVTLTDVSQKLNDVTSLISPTCDMFIRTLEECMEMVQSSSVMFDPQQGQQSPITDATLPPSPLRVPNKKGKNVQRQSSGDRASLHSHSRSPSISSMDATPPSRQTFRQRSSSDASLSDISNKDLTLSSLPEQHSSGKSNSQNQSTVPVAINRIVNSNSNQSRGNVQSNSNPDSKSTNQNQVINSNTNGRTSSSSLNGVNVNNSSSSSAENGTSQNCGNVTVIQSKTYGKQTTTRDVSNTDVRLSEYPSSDGENDGEVFLDPIEEPRVATFFSAMPISLVNLTLASDGGIPVEPFLNSCKNLLPIFDKLNSTAFAPVKMDFQGNIRKVRTKYQVHPEKFVTLQSIVLHEISKKQQYLPSSATMALLWMKRSLQFISGFVSEIKNGEQNLGVAASNAYANSLKPFHGWVVRGVFAVAVKALPYRNTFLCLLNPADGHVDEQLFQISLMSDIDAFCDASKVVVETLDNFFASNNLNVKEQI